MYHAVRKVEAGEPYRLVIQFDNGETRVFDVAPQLSTGRFGELAVPDAFRKVRVAFDTIEWENGLDLDPEYLYDAARCWTMNNARRVDTANQTTNRRSGIRSFGRSAVSG